MQHEELQHLRHSLAHLLGAAVLELYPGSKLTLGPAIDNGFYYDVDITGKISEDDLVKIEAKMQELITSWSTFSKQAVDASTAQQTFEGNQYKHELIGEIVEKGEEISLYTSGNFTDLCRGGHIENMQDIKPGSWKLDRVAGAYWRGNEKNKMLTRIYGLAFETKEALDAYVTQQTEAEKRDHRKLAKELSLFTISDLVGSGLPLWQPKGTILRQELTNFLWDLHKHNGYNWVTTPHIAKEALYETSGHAGHYMEDMFSVHGGTSKENFFLKPMNCPHHMQIFSSSPWSYRDMPVRYFEPATVYRDEKTGQLSGLTRVRSITQDDGHLFCRVNQIHDEVATIVDIIKQFYTTFGMIEGYRVRLSLREIGSDKYLGSDEVWEKAEKALTAVCEDHGLPYFEGPGEAAFYGPKLDFMFKDAIGREHQLATVQLDFNLPERFDLSFTNEEGKAERPVVIHRAISGSLERFLGVAIEHFAGAFPVWMSPVQVSVLPVSEEHHGTYAKELFKKLQQEDIRVELLTEDSLGKRIRHSKTQKVPYQIVIGDKEKDSGNLTIEGRGDKMEMSIDDFVEKISNEIKNRTLN
ncbi:MAG: threonine--tRNA ligase [bacterium]